MFIFLGMRTPKHETEKKTWRKEERGEIAIEYRINWKAESQKTVYTDTVLKKHIYPTMFSRQTRLFGVFERCIVLFRAKKINWWQAGVTSY